MYHTGGLSANNKHMCCCFFMDAQASMKQTTNKLKQKKSYLNLVSQLSLDGVRQVDLTLYEMIEMCML